MYRRYAVVVCAFALTGCEAAKATMNKIANNEIMVTTTPASVTVPAGAKQYFTASVDNTSDQRVNWYVIGVACGTITIDGVYRAPVVIPTGPCAVRAVSQADTRKNSDSSVAVGPPVSVSISPTSATVPGCTTQTFTASVSNTPNQGVNWYVLGAGCGMITVNGVYRSPPAVPTGTCIIRAMSVIDDTKTMEVQVTPTVYTVSSVVVSPPSVSLQPGQTQQFTATVTTSCGVYTSSTTAQGVFSAPDGRVIPKIISQQ